MDDGATGGGHQDQGAVDNEEEEEKQNVEALHEDGQEREREGGDQEPQRSPPD